jgi:class 3 adenylate cyclase
MAFAYLSLERSWLFALFGFWLPALGVALEGLRRKSVRNRLVRGFLAGLSSEVLDEILNEAEALDLSPKERVVSVLTIDIIGFSEVMDSHPPKEVFQELHTLLEVISRNVHRYQGVVDRAFGEEILCYFGYRYGRPSPEWDHADQALACAIAIHKEIAERGISQARLKLPVFALRVGINSDSIYIGDVGKAGGIDVTLLGKGVTLAKRLEAACDPNSILLGAKTADLLSPRMTKNHKLKKREVRVANTTGTVEAYECDPFADKPELLSKIEVAYRDYLRLQRKETRFTIPGLSQIRVQTEHGLGFIVDFSLGGLGIELERSLQRGMELHLTIDDSHKDLKERLAASKLVPIPGEVRWSRPVGPRFLVGFKLENLSKDQQEALKLVLQTYLQVAMKGKDVPVESGASASEPETEEKKTDTAAKTRPDSKRKAA